MRRGRRPFRVRVPEEGPRQSLPCPCNITVGNIVTPVSEPSVTGKVVETAGHSVILNVKVQHDRLTRLIHPDKPREEWYNCFSLILMPTGYWQFPWRGPN